MLFSRPVLNAAPQPTLGGDGIILRAPIASDYEAWAALRDSSRDHLRPFEPAWAEDELSSASFRYRLKRYQHEARNDQGYSFFVLDPAGRALLGGISLSGVRRGARERTLSSVTACSIERSFSFCDEDHSDSVGSSGRTEIERSFFPTTAKRPEPGPAPRSAR